MTDVATKVATDVAKAAPDEDLAPINTAERQGAISWESLPRRASCCSTRR